MGYIAFCSETFMPGSMCTTGVGAYCAADAETWNREEACTHMCAHEHTHARMQTRATKVPADTLPSSSDASTWDQFTST